MREFKFRVWDKCRKIMEFVGALDWDGRYKLITCNTETDKLYKTYNGYDFDLMQYTGLTDKKGLEVYEGDIVNHSVFGVREITWGSPKAGLKESLGFMYNGTIAFLGANDNDDVEVIGNIYENPELLKTE